MNSKYDEPGINVKDLFLMIARKIWVMLIAGVILGVALGSYKICNRVKSYDVLDITTKLNSSETDVQYQLRVQNIKKARSYVEMISSVNTLIEHQRQYITDSLYMQINPEKVYQASAQISLTLSDDAFTGTDLTLFAAYERDIRSGNYLDEYAYEKNYKPEYIRELIAINNSVVNNSVITIDNDANSVGSIYITVIGPSSDFCSDVMNIVIAEINSIHSDLNNSVAPHSITVVGTQQLVRVDDGLRKGQNDQISRIDTLQKQIVSYNESLDKIAKELGLSGKETFFAYFETHEEVVVDGIPNSTSERYVSVVSMIKPGLKYSAVGFIVGAFLVFFVVVLQYLFGKRFKTQAQFFYEFPSIQKIGVMKPTLRKSHYSRFIDIKSGDDSNLSKENINQIITYNYENLTKDHKNILITGVGNKDDMCNAIKVLGLRGDFKPNIFNNPEILKCINNYDCVVLIEQRNYSPIKSIAEEISLISNCNTEIIGAVII